VVLPLSLTDVEFAVSSAKAADAERTAAIQKVDLIIPSLQTR